MELTVFAVIAVVTLVTVASFSQKLGIAAPLILVVVGIIYSFIPGVPSVEVPPDWILMGVLPPLLYAAAINVPLMDFRRNLGTIASLSILLVIVTSIGVGFLLFALFPELNLAAAIALGAVISPTDAVAATAIAKKLGLPARLITILEGESLVNDATALVLLKAALAASAMAFSDFQLGSAVGMFAYSAVVAVAVGLVVGFVTVFIRSKLDNPILDTAISFVVPFIAYIPAEEVGASGVLAVVAAGLVAGHNGARYFGAQERINERSNWRTIEFLLENGVFLLMGLELKAILGQVHEFDLGVDKAVYVGLLVTVLLIVVRFAFIGPLILSLRRRDRRLVKTFARVAEGLERTKELEAENPKLTRKRERAQKVYDRRSTDLEQLRADGLGLRGGVVLSWAGMRGVVTLAAAQSLPADIPYRPQLILIAFTVSITTLLVQGGTLPWIIRATGIRGSDAAADRREFATLLDEISEAGLSVLENPTAKLADGMTISEDVIERVRRDTLLRQESAWERSRAEAMDEVAQMPHMQYRELRLQVLQAERAALLDARSRGTYPSRVLTRAQGMLDLEEARLDTAL